MFRKKIILLLPALLFLVSCSFLSVGPPSKVVTHQSGVIETKLSPTVFVRIKTDTERLNSDISARLEGLGFKAVTSMPADYYADVDYATYWDAAHQTFKHFDIDLVDARSGERKIDSHYIGRGSFNGCRAALDMVFKDLGKHINGT